MQEVSGAWYLRYGIYIWRNGQFEDEETGQPLDTAGRPFRWVPEAALLTPLEH